MCAYEAYLEELSSRQYKNTIVHQGEPRCFKCGKVLDWSTPNGVVFSGGGNFGSELYDTMLDDILVSILICDGCLKANRGRIMEKQCK